MVNFKNYIFELFSSYDHQVDPNKDTDGKGTNQRYNEIVGNYIDEELIKNIDNLVGNNLLPDTAYDRFLPYLEERLGVDLYIYNTLEWRRRVLKYIQKWYLIKGTVRSYKLMFSMLGFTDISVNEYLDSNSFDSSVTFDDPDRVFDMSACNRCVGYDLMLFGDLEINPDIVAAIDAIIKFNEPINGFVKSIFYNDTPLVYKVISVWVDEFGDLNYSNEYDPYLILSLREDGSLNIGGENSYRYHINDNGDLIYTYGDE